MNDNATLQTGKLSSFVDGDDCCQRREIDSDPFTTVAICFEEEQHILEVDIRPEHPIREHGHRQRRKTMSALNQTNPLLSKNNDVLWRSQTETP